MFLPAARGPLRLGYSTLRSELVINAIHAESSLASSYFEYRDPV